MSDENNASYNPPFGDPGFSPLRKTVKSYGISIDSSRIHEVAYEEQPETLRELGVNVFDQHVFEEGVYRQVDEAIAEQEALAYKKRLENELKTVEEDQRTGEKQQKSKLLKVQDKHQKNEDCAVQDSHYDEETPELDECEENKISDKENSAEELFRMGSQEETEVERLIRFGEMTPFGSKVDFKERMVVDDLTEESSGERDEKEPDQLKKDELLRSQVDKGDDGDGGYDGDGGHGGGGDITGGGEDGDFNLFDGHDTEGAEGTSTSVLESDDDYIPDEEELKLSWEDDQVLHSEHDDVSAEEEYEEPIVKAKKVKKHKPLKKSTRLKHSTKDDGDDRLYQIRIRDYKLKKVLREKGIDYSGKSDEEDDDEFWNEEGLDEEFEGGLKIPAVIWNKLFRFQKTGVKWLWELHCQQAGGIVGDEMGLGKTIQMIAFLVGLKYSNIGRRKSNKQCGLGPVLIVCPATVLFQWVAEFHKWWPEFRVAVLHDTGSYQGPKDTLINKMRNSPGSILITTYSGVRLNQDHLLPCRWDYVILDEGHIIRNPDAEITLACKQFRTCHRIVLSGSPMQNNLRELWSLFDFVFPGKLGTLPVFMQEFSVPITTGGYANATSVQVQTAYKCACVLRDTINPYLLRRMKNDVKMKLNLPNKNEQVLFCRLTEEQTEIYKEYLASREVGSILSGTMKVFPGLIMLRKICNHPDLTTEAGSLWKLRKDEEQTETGQTSGEEMVGGYGYWKRSGKLVVVHSLLKLWKRQKHKVLLFTQTRQMLKILEIFVQSQGYNYSRMDGSTSISSRQPLIEKFNKDKSIFVFLLTTRVGGLGVNLIGANRVIIYDPDWNPGTDMQARERAWRVGQKKDVTIYRLLTTGTIEEKIYHRQIFKQFLTNRVLKDPKQRRFFKSNDLFELFTLDTSDGKKTGTETGAIFAGLGCEVKVPLGQKKGTKRKMVEPSDNASVLKMMRERTKEILKAQFSSSKKQNTQTNDSHPSEARIKEQSVSFGDARKSSDYTRHSPDNSDITSMETNNTSRDRKISSDTRGDAHKPSAYTRHSPDNSDITSMETSRTSRDRKISLDIPGDARKPSDCSRDSSENSKITSKSRDRENHIKNTVSNVCDELPLSTTDAGITYKGSCDVTGSDHEVCDIGRTQTSVKDFSESEQNGMNIAPIKISPGADEGRKTKTFDRNSSAPRKEEKGKVKKKSKKKKRNRVEGIRIGQLSHSEPYVSKKDGEDGDETRGGDDDHYILRKLFKKSGVHSALQHDTIVNSGNSDHLLVENEAQRVAAQAAEALRRSREQCMQLRTSGLPTWTGQSGFVGSPHGFTKKTMFGPKTKTKAPRKEDSTMHFSGETLLEGKAGADTKATSAEPMSSTQLLARMRARNFSGGNDAGSEVPSTEQKYQETMGEVRNFIATRCSQPGRATTREILEEFSSKLPVGDSAVFRAMLRKICDFDRGVLGEGYWVLKAEFTGTS